MTNPQPHPEPVEQLLAEAERLGVSIVGQVPGPGGPLPDGGMLLYGLPPGDPNSPAAHALIDLLAQREPEVVDALVVATAEAWAAAPWAIG
jgi:hypothetical protein